MLKQNTETMEIKFKTAQGMLDHEFGIPNPDDPGMTPEEHQQWLVEMMEDCLGMNTETMEEDLTFHAANGLVYVEDASGEIARHSVTEFYDAIPQAPDRGTARIPNFAGDPVIRECAIIEWDEFSQCLDELITRREFVPLDDYINDYAEDSDLYRAHLNLTSQKVTA